MQIKCASGSYPIQIKTGILDALRREQADRLFLIDSYFAPLFDGADVLAVEATEQNKSLDRLSEVICGLRERGASRRTQVVAVGGGVIQDIAAFASTVYMRGIDYVYMPTTLLGMVDSCIGGKSSINVGRYKNIVGTVAPPSAVLIDPAFARTLSPLQIAEGLFEAVKICFARGEHEFNAFLALAPTIESGEDVLNAVIELSLRSKSWFIEIDEFDKAERLQLNFGHSFGHAIEAASDFRISHGIAVGLGMLTALHLGSLMGDPVVHSARSTALRTYIDKLMMAAGGMDSILASLSIEDLLSAFDSDKKHTRSEYAVIMVAPNGMLERRTIARDEVHRAMIGHAFAALINERGRGPGILERITA